MKWEKKNIDKELWNLNRHKRDNRTLGHKEKKTSMAFGGRNNGIIPNCKITL